METPRRRASDQKALDIEGMIAEENDPKQRAFLIVLNSINNGLVANTDATRDMAKKFDEHLSTYETHTASEAEMVNKARGMWRVLAWVLGVSQMCVVWLGLSLFRDLGEIHAQLNAGQISAARIELRVNSLEGKKP